MNKLMQIVVILSGIWVIAGCGGGQEPPDPTMIPFGTTAIVVVVNPPINDDNAAPLPTPGTTRQGVTVTTDEGTRHVTNADGVAVLAPVTAGTRTVTLSGTGVGGSFTVNIGDGQLKEVAVASASADVTEIMVEIDYTTDQVQEILPSMTNQEVNNILSVSNTVVFIRGGTYTGDIDFSGSRVTLFGEGALGGQVTIDGNIVISGSDSRIRGTTVTGMATAPASGVGLSFSRVDGATSVESSNAMLLVNQVCGGLVVTGSDATILANTGAAPLPACP